MQDLVKKISTYIMGDEKATANATALGICLAEAKLVKRNPRGRNDDFDLLLLILQNIFLFILRCFTSDLYL